MKNIILLTLLFCSFNSPLFAQDDVKTIQPKIIVVPYVIEGQTIRSTIENDFNKRKAISMIKEAFLQRGYETVDFIAKFRADKTTAAMTREAQESLKEKIIANSGADIMVTVEYNVSSASRGNKVDLILSAQDTYSGGNMAEKSPSSPAFATEDYPKLIAKAMEDPEDGIEPFLVLLNESFGRIVENGADIKLVIQLDEDCEFKFTDDIDDDFNTLASVIELWGKKNANKGYAKPGGTSPTAFSFDPIRVPLRASDGSNYSVESMLIKDLRKELKAKYNIKTRTGSRKGGVFYLYIVGYYD